MWSMTNAAGTASVNATSTNSSATYTVQANRYYLWKLPDGASHINDVQWPARDHRAPFFGGDVDFDHLLPRFFKRSMPLTWELSPSVTAEHIKEAKIRWDALMQQLPEA